LFDNIEYDEMLFMTGDKTKWMIMDKN